MAIQEYWYATGGSGANSSPKFAQTFTAESSYTLTSVYLKLATGTYITGSATISLYSVDGEHKPNSFLTSIGTITPGELSGSLEWIEFDGLSYSIVEGTEYAIVLTISSYDETYADQENIPSVTTVYKSGYWPNGYGWVWYWYWDDPVWRHTSEWSSRGGEFGFICAGEAGGTVYAEGTKVVIVTATCSVLDPPGKAQNPTPTDDAENIIISGYNRLKKLQWEAPD